MKEQAELMEIEEIMNFLLIVIASAPDKDILMEAGIKLVDTLDKYVKRRLEKFEGREEDHA